MKSQYAIIPISNGEDIKLTFKRDIFARYYAQTGDAANSRIQAGFKGHSNAFRNSNEGYKLLQYKEVQRAVEYYRSKLSEKMDISENRLLAEMAAMGFSNIAKLFHDNGDMKKIAEVDEATQRAIKSVKTRRQIVRNGKELDDYDEYEIQQIDLHPKLPALQQIADIKGMTKAKDKEHERNVTVTVNIGGKDVNG